MKKTLLILSFIICFTENKAQVLNTSFCQTNGSVDAVAIDSVNNVVYIGGNFTTVCGTPRSRIAAMNLTTGALLPWNPGCNNDIYALYIHNNALYVGGFFTTIGGQAHKLAAKFYLPGGTLSTWAPAITTGNWVQTIVAKGNKVYLGGNFLLTVSTGQNLCEVDTGTAAATNWPEANLNAQVNSLAINGTQLIVGGAYTNIASSGIDYLSKFYLSGTGNVLAAWNPAPDARISSVLARGSNIYIGGAFTILSTDIRSGLACVDSATGVATSWNPGVNNDPTHLVYRNGIIYAVGNFSVIGGKSRWFIGAIDINTGIATNWDVQVTATMNAIATTPTQIYMGGSMSTVLGQARTNFAVVCINPVDTLSSGPVGLTTVCTGLSGVSYSVAPASGATSYAWGYTGTGATIVGSTNSITINFSPSATSGNVTVQAINNCESSNIQTLAVNVYTFATTVSPNSNNITCGDSVDISSSDNYAGSGSISYSWSPATGLNFTNVYKVTSGVHATTTYTLTETSSEGCVAKDNTTITVAPIAINLSSSAPNILCSTSDSLFATNNYNGTGVLTYTWSPSASLNLSDPTKPVASPVVTTDYTVTANATGGCSATPQTITVLVDAITVTAGSGMSSITCGNTSTLNVSTNYPGVGTITYTWSPAGDLNNANIASPVASPTTNTVYTVNITTAEGCLSSDVTTVLVNPLQVFTSGVINTTCSNPVTLTTNNNSGNVNLVYSWSPAGGLSSTTSSAPSANVGTTTVFTVTMSLPSTGCASAMEIDSVKIAPPVAPNICEISTDSLSQYNIVYWDKTSYQPTDSFIIYRETLTNIYTQIGIVACTALSEFTDTTRHIGPSNGDPNVGTYRYKLAVKDSCGNISAKSPYHNTVFFVDNHTGTFTWNLYAVEAQTTPVTQFDLLRDNANNGTWIVIGTVTGTQTTLNDAFYSTYSTIANWRVQALGFNCTPTARYGNNSAQGAIVKSKSNITNNRQIGIKTNLENNVAIYPNPSNGNFLIDFGVAQGKVTVKVISVIGEEVYNNTTNASEKLNVDLSNYQGGTYIVQITSSNSTVTKRIIKN